MLEHRNKLTCLDLLLHTVTRNLDYPKPSNSRSSVDLGAAYGDIERQHHLSHHPLDFEVERVGLAGGGSGISNHPMPVEVVERQREAEALEIDGAPQRQLR